MSADKNKLQENVNQSIEISIRLLALAILLGACALLLVPFFSPVLWGGIIAVALYPLHVRIKRLFGGRGKLSAGILISLLLLLLILPSFGLVNSLVDSIHYFAQQMREGKLAIPMPDIRIKDWPFIGEKLYEAWYYAAGHLEETIEQYRDLLATIGGVLIKLAKSISGGLIQLILSIVIAGFLMESKSSAELMEKFFIKILGARGPEFLSMTVITIKNVAKGVLGVALIQSLALGIVFSMAAVPFGGFWALLCLFFSIIQLGPSLVVLGVILFLYSNLGAGMATLWTVILLIINFSDNVLKPLIMAKGAPVPMLVIFLGTLGGFISMGFIGLFTGAIILSVVYVLFMEWLGSEKPAQVKSDK